MHDINLEERLRSVLRQEGDGLPFTITTDELDRRLALRRRARTSQRLSLMAAGLAVLAVGAVFALGSGWLRSTNVATDPSPSPNGSAAPIASSMPTPTADVTPRPTDPIGPVEVAILVTPQGSDSERPDSFAVTTVDPSSGTSTLLATFPGAILQGDGWLEGQVGTPKITATGWLAIPFTRGPNVDETRSAIAIVDIRAPDADPWIIDEYSIMGWSPADELVVERNGAMSIASPASRSVERIQTKGVARISAISADPAAPFLATSLDEAELRGYVVPEGTFTATNDQPAVYQRTGRERPVGADGHGLGPACDSGPDDASSGCWLVETDATHEPVATWVDLEAEPGLDDFTWASDGRSVWMLLDDGATGGRQIVSLTYAATVESRVERAQVDVSFDGRPGARSQFLGFSDEPTPGSAAVVAIGDDLGFIQAFVMADGTVVAQDGASWFAGWADDPTPYDPD